MLRMRDKEEHKIFPNFFRADEIRRELGESLPVTLHYDINEDIDTANSNTTYALFSLNETLAHTKDLMSAKKPKHNYITALLLRGIRVIKNTKKGQ